MSGAARLVWRFALPPVVAVGLMTLVMLGFGHRLLSDSMLDSSELRVRQRAAVLSRQLDAELRDAVNAVRLLARSPLVRPGAQPAATRAELDNLVAQSGKFVWVGLVGLDGQVLVGSRGWLQGRSIASRPVFTLGRGGMIGDVHPAVALAPLLAALPGGPTELIDIGEPVRDEDGQVIGVIAAHLGLQWIRAQVAVAIGSPEDAARLGLQAYVVTGKDNHNVVPDQAFPRGLPLADAQRPLRWTSPDGHGLIVGQSLLTRGETGADTLPWRAIVTQSEAVVLDPAYRLSRYMVGVGAVAALLLAGLSVWLSRRLLAPWGSLFDAALSSPSHGDLRMSAEVSARVRALLDGRGSALPAERMLGWLAQDVDNLRRAIDHLPIGLVLMDREFRVEYVNPAFTQMLGWDTDNCRGLLGASNLLDPADRPQLAPMYAALDDPPGSFAMRLEARTAAEGRVWVQWQMVPMTDSRGQWVGGLAVVQDIGPERMALRRAEALANRLRALADAAVDTLLATLDPEGCVLEWSRGAERLTGISAARAVGRPLAASLGGTAFQQDCLSRALERGIAPVVIEAAGRHFEGSIYELGGAGQLSRFGLILRDTSERRALFAQLQLSEQRLRMALEAAKLATWEADLTSDPWQVLWSEDYARMLGLPLQAQGSSVGLSDLVHPQDWQGFRLALQQSAQTGDSLNIEFRIRHHDGWRHHALYGQVLRDEQGRAHRLLGAGMDVTEQRLARQALVDSEARFGAIIANASDAIISVDLDGHIGLFTPAAERVFGYKADEMLGQPLSRLLPEPARAHHPAMMAGFAKSGVTQRAMGAGLVRGIHADGHVLELEASISQAVANGKVVMTAILRDVSERVAQERLLEQARDELAQLNRRLLDQEKQSSRRLAQALHDELGQTLAALRLHWEAYAAAAAAQRERLEPRIARLVEAANRQMRSVLAELRPPFLDELGLAAALDNEIRQHEPADGDTVVRLEASDAAQHQRWLPDVEYAAFMIAREALLNALRHARASEITVTLDGDADSLRLSVRDDGIGIEPGTRAGRPGHLGLIGMRERAHGIAAHLQVEGSAGGGTIVTLTWTLPP